MLHREFTTPALRLAVIRPRTDPNQEKNIHTDIESTEHRLQTETASNYYYEAPTPSVEALSDRSSINGTFGLVIHS